MLLVPKSFIVVVLASILQMRVVYYRMMEMELPLELPCKDKLAFDTKKEAETTANVVDYRYGSKVRAYKCRYCYLWHLASKS